MTSRTTTNLDRLHSLLPIREGNVDEVLQQVALTVDEGGADVVRDVLLLADDNCELEGVIDTILSTLETLPATAYVPELLKALPDFLRMSPGWCANEVRKLLWTEDALQVLRDSVAALAPSGRAALGELLREIAAEEPRLQGAVQRVLEAL